MCNPLHIIAMWNKIMLFNKPLRHLEELSIDSYSYIFSLLPMSRDIVRLRYVSCKIRSISKTSTLRKNFLLPWYDSREERSVNEVLKACGTHIKWLTFSVVSRGMASSTSYPQIG